MSKLDFTNVPKLTREQAAIIGAYTGITAGPFGDVMEYVDGLPGFEGITDTGMAAVYKKIKIASKADFLKIISEEN